MEFPVNPNGLQKRHENSRETMNGLKTEPALNKREGFDQNVIRRKQNTPVIDSGLPGFNHFRVPGFVAIEKGVQRRCVNE